MRNSIIAFAFILGLLTLSCSKDSGSTGDTVSVYYVIEGLYGYNPSNPQTGNVINVIVDMTMPAGTNQHGLVTTPYTSVARDYATGMSVTLRGESVPSYTTITVKLFKDGTEWKTFTTTATGAGNYAVATVTGTL